MHPAYKFLADELRSPHYQRYADRGQLNLREIFVSQGYYDALKDFFKETYLDWERRMVHVHISNNSPDWQIVNIHFVPPIHPEVEVSDVDFS